jgi:3-hydroxyacyl-[acyl-carrier-protein] dehydratase
MTTEEKILSLLPYQKPFRFVDAITHTSPDGVSGHYTYREEEFFYSGHFPGSPVTPGVILTETAAQIGLVALGIYLIMDKGEKASPLFSYAQMDFLKKVYPRERVHVHSEKMYFRFNKLKCKVKMTNDKEEVVCEGYLAGFVISESS